MKILGWLVECEGRSLFIRDREEIQWAIEDENYTVIELIDAKHSQTNLLVECEESRQLLMEIYELQESEIFMLRERLKGFEK